MNIIQILSCLFGISITFYYLSEFELILNHKNPFRSLKFRKESKKFKIKQVMK